MALELTKENFEELVLKSNKPVLVDFWAEWCNPCKMIGPVIDEIHDELSDKAIISKVNVDLHSDIAREYGVRNIPTILFFKDGEVYDKLVGFKSKEEIKSKIESKL